MSLQYSHWIEVSKISATEPWTLLKIKRACVCTCGKEYMTGVCVCVRVYRFLFIAQHLFVFLMLVRVRHRENSWRTGREHIFL
jgi:hypothetical protein